MVYCRRNIVAVFINNFLLFKLNSFDLPLHSTQKLKRQKSYARHLIMPWGNPASDKAIWMWMWTWMRTEMNLNESEIDLNESEIDLNESEINLNECEHFLKANLVCVWIPHLESGCSILAGDRSKRVWDQSKRVWTLSQSKPGLCVNTPFRVRSNSGWKLTYAFRLPASSRCRALSSLYPRSAFVLGRVDVAIPSTSRMCARLAENP